MHKHQQQASTHLKPSWLASKILGTTGRRPNPCSRRRSAGCRRFMPNLLHWNKLHLLTYLNSVWSVEEEAAMLTQTISPTIPFYTLYLKACMARYFVAQISARPSGTNTCLSSCFRQSAFDPTCHNQLQVSLSTILAGELQLVPDKLRSSLNQSIDLQRSSDADLRTTLLARCVRRPS